jgi:hypothetical protein
VVFHAIWRNGKILRERWFFTPTSSKNSTSKKKSLFLENLDYLYSYSQIIERERKRENRGEWGGEWIEGNEKREMKRGQWREGNGERAMKRERRRERRIKKRMERE